MEYIRLSKTRTLASAVLALTLLGCSAQSLQTPDLENELTLPDFSFIGLAEPMSDRENIRVTVYVKIPYSELKFIRSNKQFETNYEVGITLADKSDERIAGSIWKDSLTVDNYDLTRADDLFIEALDSYVIPASPLTLTVRVTDLFTKKSRILSDAVDHSNMYSQDLALGNIAILESPGDSLKDEVLTHQSFDEIIDTLRFRVKLLGQQGPYNVAYTVFHKDEKVYTGVDLITQTDPIDSTLHYFVPLTDMHYSSYSLVLTAVDGNNVSVKTRSKFKVNIKGIDYQVGDLEAAVKQLRYIAGDRQVKFMLEGSEDERMQKFKTFWSERDPSPGTGSNELMEEYYRRVSFTIEAFTNVQEGWKTDRGMVYILFGRPDEIEQGPFEVSTKPYEIWHYYHLSREFVFIDETGFGDYRLVNRYTDQRDWRFRY